ncbi:MAG: VWA domain-containing protein [Terriglobales bacterium]
MRRRNENFLPLLLLLIVCSFVAAAQTTPPASPPPAPATQSASPQSTSPPPSTSTQSAPAPAAPSSQPPDTASPAPQTNSPQSNSAPPPQDSTQPPDSADNSGVFVFKKEVEEVVLHATVIDNKQHIVTNLNKGSFSVFEDGHPQPITSFRHEDIPVAMCIVIDNSGSMREKRDKVNAAALNLVRASNPNDEVCVVNFNDEYYLDQDFTSNINKLKEGLDKIETRGGTALYDAVVASATHLKESAKLEKKVIFVVTDGDDNESSETLEQAIRRLQAENGPTVYAIGILDEHSKHAKRALQVMCDKTGGIAFLPKTLDEVDAITRTIAHDIRSQYTIGYKPTTPKSQGGYRTVRVDARSPNKNDKLTVRTKSGYYAGPEPSAGGH